MALAGFIEFLLFLWLGLIVLSRSPKHPLHLVFFMVSVFCAGIVGVFALISIAPEGGDVTLLVRIHHSVIALTGASFVAFSSIFPYDRKRKFLLRSFVAFGIAFAVSLLSLFTPWDVSRAVIDDGLLSYKGSWLNTVWVVLLLFSIFWMALQCFLKYSSANREKRRFRLFLPEIGIMVGTVIALVLSRFFVSLGHREYYPWGILIGGFTAIAFLTWAVISQRWLELRTAFFRTALWALTSALLFVPIIVFIKYTFFLWRGYGFFRLGLLATGIGLLFAVYYSNFQHLVDLLFRRNRTNRDRLTEEFTSSVLSVRNPEELAIQVKHLFSRHLFVDMLQLLIREPDGTYRDATNHLEPADISENLAGYLLRKRGMIDLERIMSDPDGSTAAEETFRFLVHRRGAVHLLPFVFDGELAGVAIFGSKVNGRDFNFEDRGFLRLFQDLFAVALSNALMYEKLEIVLDDKTRELQEQNQALEFSVNSNERSLVALRSLNDLAKILLSMHFYSVDEFFLVLAQAFTGFFGSEKVAVYHLDRKQGKLRLAAKNHIALQHCRFPEEIPLSDTPLVHAIVDRTPTVVYNAAEENDETRALLEKLEMRSSMICIPVLRLDGSGGVACLIDREGDVPWQREELQFLNTVQVLAGNSLDKAQVIEERIQSERFSSIGQMAASIVHDIRNPIMAIRGMAECLGSPEFGEDERQDFIETIMQEAGRLADLANEVLDFSRGELRLDVTETDVPEFLADVESHLGYLFRQKHIRFTTDIAYRGTARFDPSRMRRVLDNIAQNAYDVMNDEEDFLLTAAEENGKLLFRLTDHGPGIPESYRDRIFEPFFTAGKAGGTGLGMATSRRIVEQHGGRISFTSTPESGTTFTVELPLYDG
jgi:nitrogen-specific signal transduction histidine kinase